MCIYYICMYVCTCMDIFAFINICICYLLFFFWDVCLVHRLAPQQGFANIVGQVQLSNPQQKWPQPKSTMTPTNFESSIYTCY